MNASTDQQTNPELHNTSEERPVSRYTLSFGRDILTDEEREFLMERSKPRAVAVKPEDVAGPRSVVNRRNLGLLAAILAIAVVHFSLQLNFSRREQSLLRRPLPVVEAPSVPDSVAPAPLPSESPEFQSVEISSPEAVSAPAPARRVPAPRPAKPAAAPRAEPTESRAERLRRAEKILTGI